MSCTAVGVCPGRGLASRKRGRSPESAEAPAPVFSGRAGRQGRPTVVDIQNVPFFPSVFSGRAGRQGRPTVVDIQNVPFFPSVTSAVNCFRAGAFGRGAAGLQQKLGNRPKSAGHGLGPGVSSRPFGSALSRHRVVGVGGGRARIPGMEAGSCSASSDRHPLFPRPDDSRRPVAPVLPCRVSLRAENLRPLRAVTRRGSGRNATTGDAPIASQLALRFRARPGGPARGLKTSTPPGAKGGEDGTAEASSPDGGPVGCFPAEPISRA